MKTPFPLYAKIIIWFMLNLLVVGAVAFTLLRARFGNSTDWLLASDSRQRIQSMTEVLIAELAHTPSEFHEEVLNRFGLAYHLKLSVYSNHGEKIVGPELKLPAVVRDALGKAPEPAHNHGPPPPRALPPPPHLGPLETIFADPFERQFSATDREGPGDGPPQRRQERPGGPNGPGGQEGPGGLGGPGGPGRSHDGPPNGGPPGGPEEYEGDGGPTGSPASFAFPLELIRTDSPGAYWLLIRAPVREQEQGRDTPVTLVGRIHSLADSGLLFNPRPWLYWGVALLLFSFLFWLPLVRNLTRAISKMTRATEQIAEGNFDVRINEQRRDELGRLGHAINMMSARLSGFVTGQKRFLGDIAHELCSPLVRMEMGLGVMEQRAPADLHERLSDVQEEVREMRDLVNELLCFSKAGLRAPDAPLQALGLEDIVTEVVEREGDGHVVSDVPPGIQVQADSRLLLRALGNLVRNAVRYASFAGPVQVSAVRSGAEVHIKVADQGPGVPEESLPRLFDAFYRPDEARSRETGGVGLGLAIVKSCVEACGGSVTARNREEGGFEVEMAFSAV